MLLPKRITMTETNSKSPRHAHIPHTSMWLRIVVILAVVLSGLALMSAHTRGKAATGTISGVVFQDYNSNGVQDTAALIMNIGNGSVGVAVDRGVPGVTVTAYTSAGAVAGSAVTGSDGTYSINTAGSTGPYRVEFTNIPAGFYDSPVGANSHTSVQFVPDGNSSNISLGLVFPGDFSQNNPTLVIPCYVGGPQTTNDPVIIAFPYNAGSTRRASDPPPANLNEFGTAADKTALARANQVGTVWGLAWARTTRFLYAAAFQKKHAGFGPSGPGAIYRIDPATATVSLFVDLNAIFGAGTAGTDQHSFGDARDGGNVNWNLVGKNSLGGMVVSEDGTKLYVINLANRTLYEIPLNVAPTAGNIRTSPVPLNLPGCPSTDDARPFALQFYRGLLYVGLTCTAESTTLGGTVEGDPTKLAAYVYTVNPATLAFSGAPVFQAALNYPRRCADSAEVGPGGCFSALWKPWTPVFRNIADTQFVFNAVTHRLIYPQPWLTTIDFDNGNLILGIRDRVGDQGGVLSQDKPGSNDFYYAVSAGDILRACGSPASGWSLENNANCGGITTAGQNNGQGPGNGEYYFEDNSPIYNDETAMGGSLQIPGFPDYVEAVFHPIPIISPDPDPALFDGGVRWFRNNTGRFTKNFRIYDGDLNVLVTFGKANGLGDLIALLDQPPTEIGNYVWNDVNSNGIQDPGEPPLPGVTVRLFQGAAQVGITSTNAAGEYYFNASNVPGGILPGVVYEVRIALADGALGGRVLTVANNGTDIRDSDAINVGGVNAVIVASVPVAGASDHSFDFGFVDRVLITDLSITKLPSAVCVDPGGQIPFVIRVTNNGPDTATGVVVTDDLPNGLTLVSATPSQGSCNALDPMTCALGSLTPGQVVTITIVMNVPAGLPQTISNSATVTGNQTDPNTSNNFAQVFVPPCSVDLQITKRASPNCVEAGDGVTFLVTVTNLGPGPATGVTVTDNLPDGLDLDSANPSQGSCNASDPMTCSLGSLAAGQSVTITIQMHVPPGSSGISFTNRATVSGNEPDPNPSNNSAQATVFVLVPGDPNLPLGPGEAFTQGVVNDQKAGSVLFFNFYTSIPSTPALQNTRINITNTNPGQFVFVHLFFVDGATCSITDSYICLTKNQTTTFLTSDLDPGITGYLVAVAVDGELGCPITFNNLIGDAFIKMASGHQANLPAEAFARIPGEQSGLACNETSITTDLIFDGLPGHYDRAPRVLAASSLPDYDSGNRTLLIVNRFGGNLAIGASTLGTLFGILYNDQERAASFSFPGGCQIARELNDSFPRTAPNYSDHISAGRTGWLKLFSQSDIALMGAVINFNPSALTSESAFNQGRNLHKLTLATTATLTIPVFPAH